MNKMVESEAYLNSKTFEYLPCNLLTDMMSVIEGPHTTKYLHRKHLQHLILPHIENIKLSPMSASHTFGINLITSRCKRLRSLDLSYLSHYDRDYRSDPVSNRETLLGNKRSKRISMSNYKPWNILPVLRCRSKKKFNVRNFNDSMSQDSVAISNCIISNESLYRIMTLENLCHLRFTNNDNQSIDFYEGILPILTVCGHRLETLLLVKFTMIDIAGMDGRLQRISKSDHIEAITLILSKSSKFVNQCSSALNDKLMEEILKSYDQ
ncbi:hypothetical protein Avbf_16059 [Armadillidium vulgare]|nr:hypothetical protein Avbf_16059 [Armadillidium vulgare]